MNGRIYDPLLGRFLSADIVVQAPGNLQSYNRYSYVINNPLTLTDPSGWFWEATPIVSFDPRLNSLEKAEAQVQVSQETVKMVRDDVVGGYESGAAHMEAAITEVANANGPIDVTIGVLHGVAAGGNAAGAVLNLLPTGKLGQNAVKGAEKLATKAESAVVRAVEKAEGKAATIEKRVEGAVAQDGSKVSKAAPAAELKGGTKKETGSYTNHHESGKTYDGKGSKERSQTSARRVEKETGDKHVATEWTPAKDERGAFKDESKRLDSHGGAKSEGNYNQIESPGKKKRIEDGEL